MRIITVLFLCLFFSFNIFAQADKDSEVGIKDISLALSDDNAAAGELTDKFLTTDTPIYFIIQLDSVKAVTVKMNLIAVKADGLKPETKSVAVSFTTNGNQDRVNFNASPNDVWAAGTYRVDVFINNKFAKSRTFEIEKSPAETKNAKTPDPKSFAPRKTVKKSRKN